MATTHRIRRLGWRVRARSTARGFALRGELREAIGSRLLATLGDAFDRAAPGDEIVRLDRLDIRVRVRDLAGLESALNEGTVEAVARELSARRQAAARTQDEDATGLLFHYLETGSQPWFAAGGDRAVTLAALHDAARADWRAAVARLAALSDDARMAAGFFRLVNLLPEPEWAVITVFLASRAPARSTMVDWPAVMVTLLQATGVERAYERQRLAAAVLVAARHGAAAAGGDAFTDVIEQYDLAGPPRTAGVSDGARRWMREAWRAVAAAAPAAPAGAREAAPEPVSPWRDADPGASASTDADRLAVAVSYAGLVLLLPFVPRFFESTGVIAAGATALPADVHPRAAALLALLATGQDAVSELDLGFIKLLLGRRPDSPLPIAGGLTTPGDAGEAAALLTAVIGYWPALKQTSIDGLRQAFITRPGLVREDEIGWHLRVEPQTYDVLLNDLPWSISTTALPWLNKPISTDWPTR